MVPRALRARRRAAEPPGRLRQRGALVPAHRAPRACWWSRRRRSSVTRPRRRADGTAARDALAATADPAYVDALRRVPRRLDATSAGSSRSGQFAEALPLDEAAGAWPGRRSLEAEVNRAIVYTPGVTEVDTPVEEVVRVGRGRVPGHGAPDDRGRPPPRRRRPLRQRLAAPARARGPRREPRLGGAGRARASAGWSSTPPTPSRRTSTTCASRSGRDYADVPPLRGSYLGPPTETMDVSVEVRELPDWQDCRVSTASDAHARPHRAARADERAGDAAGALLRPRLRARDHPVHGADGRRADLGGPGQGAARARRALVGVGRLRVADQRRRPRGGRGAASRCSRRWRRS